MTRNGMTNGHTKPDLENYLVPTGYSVEDYLNRARSQGDRGGQNLAVRGRKKDDEERIFSPLYGDAERPLVYPDNNGRGPRRPPAKRNKSDAGPQDRKGARIEQDEDGEEEAQAQIRHGWDNEYSSSEYLSFLHSNFYMYFTDKRHDNNGSQSSEASHFPSKDWRMKDRMKTVSAALAICLNIGVDPPDVIKTNPTAKLEAWTDPTANLGGSKVMEQIGKRLQEQYESLSLRTRYKQYLDPSIEETKRFSVSLRRNAKDERVLFHYNGHGVPLPTASGELWVFNKNYTQYIPVGIYDLQSWLAGPSLYVYDVSHAGNILHNFNANIERHKKENEELRERDPQAPVQNYDDCIQLAACERNEMLPTNPDLPADLFTCCLTTPIDIALRWFVLQNPLNCHITIDDSKIPVPGRLQDRRSPLGELNWIFTAITDTIAWNILPRPLFKKLFRQDLMVAALFRNFLLAERIMRANHCHPVSSPQLPETHHHPLWQSWDLALEMVIRQMPMLIKHEKGEVQYDYQHSDFFAQQLTAFEVYLNSGPTEDHAPDQLPIVLQVLLSQVHRLRALILLSKFLDLGPWAVHLALSIGIFPYVVKLLQAASIELKPVMVFIWARIMAVDYTVQSDLMKDNGVQYFISIMSPNSDIPVGNASEHRAMCAFIIATFCKKYPHGQTVCLTSELMNSCIMNMAEPENPLLRQWSCLCLSMLWYDYSEAKWVGIRVNAHIRLCDLALDPVPEVRASMLHALTNFLGMPDLTDQVEQIEEAIAQSLLFMTMDGSALVRKELTIFWSAFVKRYESKFIVAAYDQLREERDRHPDSGGLENGLEALRGGDVQSYSANTIYGSAWAQVLMLSVDSHQEVAYMASMIVDYIHEAMMSSPMADLAAAVIEDITKSSKKIQSVKRIPSLESIKSTALSRPSTPPAQLNKAESYLSLSIKRTASSLRNLVVGGPSTQNQGKGSSPQSKQYPTSTPRNRLPAEWSRPPSVNESANAGHYHQAPLPPCAGFSVARTHTQQGDKPTLPLESTLLQWSTEYFREPQMRPNDPDEPGSTDYNQRLYRRTRNERIIAENQPLKSVAASSKWTRLEAFLNNVSQPTKMTFHQFDSHLVVADDKDTMTVWDFARNEQLSRFSNGNPEGSRINDAKFMNEDDQPLLMVGSSDGVLKVYRNYADPASVKCVTAFRALTELVPSNKNAGLVFDWQQGQGKALVAGDLKVIKVWNAATELCVADIPARSSSCVTSLTSDQLAGQIFVAGFGDGVVRVFDQRLNPRTAMVKVWREHRQWITNVHMQRGGVRELISGSRNGEVKLWDLRNEGAVMTINASHNSNPSSTYRGPEKNDHSYETNRAPTLRSLSLHEHAPVFAVGTDRHEVRSFNTNGDPLGVFEPLSSGVWSKAGGAAAAAAGAVVGGSYKRNAIVATAYHPHRMLLAVCAWGDSHVSLVGY
ncbi:Target of rapamycin complex 1 subunit kog1 [Neophaeococcomyces mojaviensis]|uniref:Target of rapamycin complex 1 subunit kog1 n=1 Tax=Neophaeococcomyces mojaviensis TaxID=3383035 RepID=A0ACC3AGV9_9EURO|nr:Target of rapamycin complex 1 subunit kog1 [Knufia sp. JES_112]